MGLAVALKIKKTQIAPALQSTHSFLFDGRPEPDVSPPSAQSHPARNRDGCRQHDSIRQAASLRLLKL